MLERLRDEKGTTLAEAVVTLALLGVVVTMFLVALESMQTGVVRAEGRSIRNDEVRLALSQMDREIRSGNVLYDPASATFADPANDVLPSMSMLIYTQSNAPTRNPGNQCVQWRISSGTLQTRMWADVPNPPATPWRTVASDIVNRDLPTPVPAFALDPNPLYYKRIVRITLVVDRPDDAAEPQETTLSITGRNTHYEQPSGPDQVCDTPPAYA